ncbi:MAG: DEAD/DEAH box helicase family protein, partial [Olegusella sp.]|nr:DEAD/DEAH box helicase family protein [Olegusella sp.]
MTASQKFVPTTRYKLIYVFEIRDHAHAGLLKIGDATVHTDATADKLPPNCKELNQAARERIKSYTNTAGVSYTLLHTELAVRQVAKGGATLLESFRDKDVHAVLENSHVHKVKIGDTTGEEWYPVDLETAKRAIEACKQHRANLSGTSGKVRQPIVLRPEQIAAVEQTVEQFQYSNRMLWNCKMRYGKTLTALEVVRRMGFKKTIIMTHRPVVDKGWYEDFDKTFDASTGYRYGSKGTGAALRSLLSSGDPFVYFASIQDLRGSKKVGGKFDKNDDVFSTVWDFVIVDEAHEGTQTSLGDETVTAVVKESKGKTKYLALSGTPFNILSDYEEREVFTWDYVMEQQAKQDWWVTHFGDSNPYEDLPELRIYTYDLGDVFGSSRYMGDTDVAFNFREFFRTWTGDFSRDHADMPSTAKPGDLVHEQDVRAFLDLMCTPSETSQYPFSTEEYRDMFRHTLWMVPGVREAKALSELMRTHPVFGSGAFRIVNVAGDGAHEDEEDREALGKVLGAIEKADTLGNYTITLSCGRLTTGVTVKEWSAVLMLSGSYSTSAANYLQTIFRVQSPGQIDGKAK